MFRGINGEIDWFIVSMMTFLGLLVLAIAVFIILGATGVITFTHDPNHPIIICQNVGTMSICNSY